MSGFPFGFEAALFEQKFAQLDGREAWRGRGTATDRRLARGFLFAKLGHAEVDV
jgi:hypothetical protein